MTDKERLKQLIELHEQEQAVLEQLWIVRQQMESLTQPFGDETICVQHGGKLYKVTFSQDSNKPKVETFQLYVLLDEVTE